LSSIQPHAGFHFTERKAYVVHDQGQVTDAVFVNKKHFVLQTQFAAQPDAACEPDFDLVFQRQIQLPRQGGCRQAPASEPQGVTLFGAFGIEIKMSLVIHGGASGEWSARAPK
jgi:hypothetical protein